MAALKIKADEFVKDIESANDDEWLMAKYGLTPDQLQSVLRQLIDMNLVSEDQLESRTSLSDSQVTRAFVEARSDEKELA